MKKTLLAVSILALFQTVQANEPDYQVGNTEANVTGSAATAQLSQNTFDPAASQADPAVSQQQQPVQKPLKPAKGVDMAVKVPMYEATTAGQGKLLGYIKVMQTDYGVEFKPDLQGVKAGVHGFHMHTNPDCKPLVENGAPAAAVAAAGHYDPESTGKHEGPWGQGHMGDLPVLYADDKGQVEIPVLAPRLSMNDVHLKSLIIHEGGDTYSDQPHHLGGGAGRMVCGVIR